MTQEPIQIPRLYGSKQDVPPANFLPRTLANFRFTPAAANYRTPPGWMGKLKLLFVLKDGTFYTKVHGYVRSDRGEGFTLPRVMPSKSVWRLGG